MGRVWVPHAKNSKNNYGKSAHWYHTETMNLRSWLVCILPFLVEALVGSEASNHVGSRPSDLSYDIAIIGSGASGLFASGAATMMGKQTALIDLDERIGGDCTNAACVPSKGLRSAAAQGVENTALYIQETVELVRRREDPHELEKRNPQVTVHLVDRCHFISQQHMQLHYKNGTSITLHAKNYVLATGASPLVPDEWKQQAENANLPLFTYRSVLRPELNKEFWTWMEECSSSPNGKEPRTLAIVGGGATACELGQALARIVRKSSKYNIQIQLIAPRILSQEDPALAKAARDLLIAEGIQHIPHRADCILPNQTLLLSGAQNATNPVDAILLCVGRSPAHSLQQLALDEAGVDWNQQGVTVHPNSLQSTSNSRVYAIGDCAGALPVRARTASQAAWMGFHAIRNIAVPRWFRLGSRSIHPYVPRVIYTDPELVCVGMTANECAKKYGSQYDSLLIQEEGSDRADMERTARNTSLSFLELRSEKGGGKVLGLTCCGPAAAELANSISIAMTNKLTARDIARSVHSYPSYGYLLHRAALSMALSDIWGLLETCGPLGTFLAGLGRKLHALCRFLLRPFRAFSLSRADQG